MTIRELKRGDLFTLKPIEDPNDSQVWIRGEYDRGSKTFSIINWGDINRERFLKPGREVFPL